MSEIELYNTLEKMVNAAEEGNRKDVLEINKEFSTLLYRRYGHLENWSMNEKVLMYDRCRNRVCDSVTNWIERDKILIEMWDRFSKIPKPES